MTRAEAENAFGHTSLGRIYVHISFAATKQEFELELEVEPEVMMYGTPSKWRPGVVYRPEYYPGGSAYTHVDGDSRFGPYDDVGEAIAYAINEGRMTADLLKDEEGKAIMWHVLHDERGSHELLRRHHIIDGARANEPS